VQDRVGLRQLRLDVNAPVLHEGYYACWDHADEDREAPSLWRAEIPLTSGGLPVGRVEVAGRPDAEPVWHKIAAVARAVEDFESAAALQCGWAAPALEDSGETLLAPAARPARAAQPAGRAGLPVPVPQAE
jgi:hypothetical protein